MLLPASPGLTTHDANRNHFLYFAAEAENVELSEFLIKEGADVNHRGVYSCPALLTRAVEKGNSELVSILLEAGAYVNAKKYRIRGATGRATALQAAVIRGDIGISRRLIGAGADVMAKEGLYGRTALQEAG